MSKIDFLCQKQATKVWSKSLSNCLIWCIFRWQHLYTPHTKKITTILKKKQMYGRRPYTNFQLNIYSVVTIIDRPPLPLNKKCFPLPKKTPKIMTEGYRKIFSYFQFKKIMLLPNTTKLYTTKVNQRKNNDSLYAFFIPI